MQQFFRAEMGALALVGEGTRFQAGRVGSGCETGPGVIFAAVAKIGPVPFLPLGTILTLQYLRRRPVAALQAAKLTEFELGRGEAPRSPTRVFSTAPFP